MIGPGRVHVVDAMVDGAADLGDGPRLVDGSPRHGQPHAAKAEDGELVPVLRHPSVEHHDSPCRCGVLFPSGLALPTVATLPPYAKGKWGGTSIPAEELPDPVTRGRAQARRARHGGPGNAAGGQRAKPFGNPRGFETVAVPGSGHLHAAMELCRGLISGLRQKKPSRE